MSRIQRTMYRLFMRKISQLEQQGLTIDFGMPMDKEAWLSNGGRHGWAAPVPEYNKESLNTLLPWLASAHPEYTGTFTAANLRQCIRDAFRNPPPTTTTNADSELLDRAFNSLKILEEQIHMAHCSSTATSENIRVDVTTAFVGTQSELDPTFDPETDGPKKFYFTYRIRVSNIGQKTVQLLSRHWIVKDKAGITVAEVAKGARGVVGNTPILKPHTCFQYYSGTDVDAPGGSMEGSFEMAVLNSKGIPDEKFEANISPFRFLLPINNKE